jgi:hypothetical protein
LTGRCEMTGVEKSVMGWDEVASRTWGGLSGLVEMTGVDVEWLVGYGSGRGGAA